MAIENDSRHVNDTKTHKYTVARRRYTKRQRHNQPPDEEEQVDMENMFKEERELYELRQLMGKGMNTIQTNRRYVEIVSEHMNTSCRLGSWMGLILVLLYG